MSQLRLRIFAGHLYAICMTPAPAKFTLCPCEGVEAKIEIESATGELAGLREWDQVTINGKQVGNRSGASIEFAAMVHATNPTIHPDND